MIKIKKLIGLGILTAAGFACLLGIHATSQNLTSQQAAERWSGNDGERYAQISAFFTSDAVIQESNVNSYRSSMQKSLEEASIKSENEKGRLWVDAYSAKSVSSASNASKTQIVNLIGVSDDFFIFHPLNLLEGYYFTKEEVTKDRVVIDEDTAWQLYGSNDVEGMNITIGTKKCKIAGVYRPMDKEKYEAAYGENSSIFIPYDLLLELNGGTAGINTYEILLPNPVKQFAKQIVLKNIAGVDLSTNTGSKEDLDELKIEIIENTNRFGLLRLYEVMKNTGFRAMERKGMVYPYWENIARAKETYASGLLLLAAVLLILPVLCTVSYLIKRFRNRKWTIKRIKSRIEEKIEERKKKKWEEKRIEKEKISN